jgi:acetolactate synthase I/II/III large subunit
MSSTTGDLVAAFLEQCGVEVVFGVISIHNMPILDAFHRRGRIRFVTARGEAGAAGMADAAARVSGKLGVFVTSTGTGAGNAAGALVEAQTAGTPLLHLTGQIDSPFLDRGFGYVHEAADQLGMLKSVSKAAFRISTPQAAAPTLRQAIRIACTPPTGPVSIEIPVDVQQAAANIPNNFRLLEIESPTPDEVQLDALADRLAESKRPLLWLGGGAREAAAAATKLAGLGVAVVTSAAGRGIVDERHPMALGVFAASPAVEELYKSIDLMVVVGSHLRSNETRTYGLRLPERIVRIDVDPDADGRGYTSDSFIRGDALLALEGLAKRLASRKRALAPSFAAEIDTVRRTAEAAVRKSVGPYAALIAAIEQQMPADALWVRDITLSNTVWGNRLPRLAGPRRAVHAMGGGIGQGLAMGIGAALATGRKTVMLAGDGGFVLNLGELATAVEEKADMVILLMNDGGYGVIRNIQDIEYGGRRAYADIKGPDFGLVAESLDLPYRRIGDLAAFPAAFAGALAAPGPAMIEIDMRAVGPFGTRFGGPARPQQK